MANDEIELTLAGGERIVTPITSDRCLTMRLKAGMEAFALVRASSVILTTDSTDGFSLSARNLLSGTIEQLHPNSVNTEVVIALKGRDTLVTTIPSEAAKELALTVGQTVKAFFKANDVIIGVARMAEDMIADNDCRRSPAVDLNPAP
jgi:molybdate transport system regulatory protein